MAIRYSAGEVLKIAVDIEQNGYRFYQEMVKISPQPASSGDVPVFSRGGSGTREDL